MIPSPFRKRHALLLGTLAVAAGPFVAADEIEEPMVMTVGTVHAAPSGNTWGYLSWEETVDGALDGGPVAVFRKDGAAADAVPYERVGVVSWLTDPLTIESMLNRAPELNDDLALLESHIDEIFGEMLEGTADLPESGDPVEVPLHRKVAALLDAAAGDAEQRANVRWLGRVHPVLNLCLGRAFAGTIRTDGPVTFEVRHWDPAAEESLEVIGRVTLDPTSREGFRLPAPGRPVEVPPDGPRGHLSVRLRWATPDDLRMRTPLHYGFNVYRVDETFATDLGYDTDPPSIEELHDYAEDTTFTEVVRVNRAPVLADRVLSEAEALDLSVRDGDREPFYFFGDDNDRFNHGEPFEDGDGFYYFLTARDLLGRDGEVSEGTHVVVCAQMPPNPPGRVWVENDYRFDNGTGDGDHHLAVQWDTRSGDEADRYYVYRFADMNEMQVATQQDYRTEDYLIAGPIEPNENGVLTYVDDGTGAATNQSVAYPAGPDDYGIPYLYTVRAETASVCGGNLSGHGAPSWGVLRQREGPDAADASVIPTARAITLDPPLIMNDVDLGIESFQSRVYQIAVQREHPAVEWAELEIVPLSLRTPYLGRKLGRFTFGDDDEVSANFVFWEGHMSQPPTVRAVAGGSGLPPVEEAVSLANFKEYPDAGADGNVARIVFTADVVTGPGLAEADPDVHVSTDPETGEILCVDVEVNLANSPRAAEWRIYRRIGQGDLELVHQEMREPDGGGTLGWQDCALPARGGVACYFVQALDDEGNPGPVTRAGCVELQPTHELPTPMLYPVESVGTQDESEARISWFSPPEGVERFEILIAPESGTPPDDIGEALSGRRNDVPLEVPGYEGEEFYVYQTGRVGVTLHGEGPEFAVNARFLSGTQHIVLVRAAGPGPFEGRPAEGDLPPVAERTRGPLSNEELFQWSAPEDEPGPLVPWPARSLPQAAGEEDSRLVAETITAATGAGVRIGEFRFVSIEGEPVPMPAQSPYPLPFGYDPNDAVFSINGRDSVSDDGSTDDSLLPAVLYRYQVPNGTFPDVPGDLVQVSPMIREIAYQVRPPGSEEKASFEDKYNAFPPGGYKDYNILQDPFIGAKVKEGAHDGLPKTHDLFILDNQPVIFGAKYRYLLVQFADNGEIDRIFPVPALNLGSED